MSIENPSENLQQPTTEDSKLESVESSSESLEQRKERIDNLWNNWEKIERNTELVNLFSRKEKWESSRSPREILRENEYPERTKIDEVKFETWLTNFNEKFCKDGFVYLLRGDYPNLDQKGFYSRTYGYGKLSTKQLAEQVKSSDEVGYLLYGDERFLTKVKPASESIAEELALMQSQRGGSSFISATTSIPCAEAGTGNVPDEVEQLSYEIYVLKIPQEHVIKSNTGNQFGLEEDEYLIPDYVDKEEILAKFPRTAREGLYQYLHETIGVDKSDLRIGKEKEE